MRKKEDTERELFDLQYENFVWSVNPKNPLMTELAAIDKLLDEVPEILDWVHADLCRGTETTPGRPGEATCEQILRSAIVMQLHGLHYRQLADQIDANIVYRKFTRFYGKKIPHFTRLNDMIKMISPETMQKVNECILRLGIKKNVEDGKAIRHDTTVAETDIAHPVDARLLGDSVRVMDRLLRGLRESAPQISFCYHNHTRAAKKRVYRIVMAKGKNIEKRRKAWYGELFCYQQKVRRYVQGALEALAVDLTAARDPLVIGIIAELKRLRPLAEQVYEQARRRVIFGQQVLAEEKIVSIFETHTDIICRGKKGSKTEFGHKFDIATGRSGMIVRYEVFKGNPCDGEVLARALEDYQCLFGKAPERLAADRRYHSKDNENVATLAGVEHPSRAA